MPVNPSEFGPLKERYSWDIPGLEAVEKLALTVDPEPEHAFQVCAVCLDLFDVLRDIHGLGAPERRLLATAALLHDTGWSTRPDAHHKGSRDIIMKTKLPGFPVRERRILACLARYHRGTHPKPSHKVYSDLDRGARDLVGRLAAILRIADGLDRTHTASACGVRVERKGAALRLLVDQRQPNPTDIWGAMRKRGLFEEVFGFTVDIATDEETP